MHYLIAHSVEEAIRLRRDTGYVFLAGGTDIYPALEHGFRPAGLVDISGVRALAAPISQSDGWWTIPAMTTWTTLVNADLPAQFDLVKQAACDIGGRQIQNTGTVGGNLCNASPAADGITALMALDARVTLVGASGQREMPLHDFVLGNRKTALNPDEILQDIRIPAATAMHASSFRKQGGRRYLVISIAMTGLFLELDADRCVARAGIAVGSCASRSVRLQSAEMRLIGMPLEQVRNFSLQSTELTRLEPISDVRASADFRLYIAQTLVEEGLRDLAKRM